MPCYGAKVVEGKLSHLSTLSTLCVQVHSAAKGLRLLTFDADGTLYADGAHMEHDNQMVCIGITSYACMQLVCCCALIYL